jgi:hypothetical protein
MPILPAVPADAHGPANGPLDTVWADRSFYAQPVNLANGSFFMGILLKVPSLMALAAILLTGAGCATGGGAPAGPDPDLLSTSTLAEHPHYSAIQMIRQFRPNWLRDRHGSFNALGVEDIANPRGVRVYVDGIDQSAGLGALDRMLVSDIHEMRKLDSTDATQRFGIGHSAGAILVTTARGQPRG